jgi:hypothetical protein
MRLRPGIRIVLLTAAIASFLSCSIQKRHYRTGFYISRLSKKTGQCDLPVAQKPTTQYRDKHIRYSIVLTATDHLATIERKGQGELKFTGEDLIARCSQGAPKNKEKIIVSQPDHEFRAAVYELPQRVFGKRALQVKSGFTPADQKKGPKHSFLHRTFVFLGELALSVFIASLPDTLQLFILIACVVMMIIRWIELIARGKGRQALKEILVFIAALVLAILLTFLLFYQMFSSLSI